MLSGCETFQAGNAKLNVAIPAECDKTPAKVPDPGEDARVAAARFAAWGAENKKRLEQQTACEKRVRENFSNGGVK